MDEIKELMEILGALFEKQDEPVEEPAPATAEVSEKCKCNGCHTKDDPVVQSAVAVADYYYALLKRLNELGVPEELAHQIVLAEASA